MRTTAERVSYDELVELAREAEFCIGRLPARPLEGVSRELNDRRRRLYTRLAEVVQALPEGRKTEDV